eukprot:2837955-Pyramimonas_sp.AAC.1
MGWSPIRDGIGWGVGGRSRVWCRWKWRSRTRSSSRKGKSTGTSSQSSGKVQPGRRARLPSLTGPGSPHPGQGGLSIF